MYTRHSTRHAAERERGGDTRHGTRHAAERERGGDTRHGTRHAAERERGRGGSEREESVLELSDLV